jgi:alkylation response protein AidB-like acyl-CoA dehydrogenase
MSTTAKPADLHLPLIPSDEETAIRESIRKLCEGFGPRYARDCYEANEPPKALWAALGEAGFTGINVPQEWGGGDLGMVGLQTVIEEVAAATGIGSLMMVVSSAIAGTVLAKHGTPEQNERWLRGIATGTTRLAFAITEPDAGTNSHELRTELRRDGDRYLLRGQKYYISGVEDAHGILVIARQRRADGSMGKHTLCIIDVDAAGLTRDEIPMPYLGPERQWTLYFDDIEVTADRLIGGEEAGMGVVFDGLNPERIAAAAVCNGLARRAMDKATAYAAERQVWGTPIGAHQGVAHPLAKAKIELELARLMTQKAAALVDAGVAGAMVGETSNMAKYAAAEAVGHCVDAAIQTHGGNGLTIEYGVSDLWWMSRTLRIAPVSEQMVLNHVAQHTLGLPKSY